MEALLEVGGGTDIDFGGSLRADEDVNVVHGRSASLYHILTKRELRRNVLLRRISKRTLLRLLDETGLVSSKPHHENGAAKKNGGDGARTRNLRLDRPPL